MHMPTARCTLIPKATLIQKAVSAALACLAVALLAGCGESSETDSAGPGAPDAGQSAQSGPGAATGSTADAGKRAEEISRSYDLGLDSLKKAQQDGKWLVQDQPNVGFTALCVANFLERPGGVREGDRAMIDAGLAFVAESLGADGSVNNSYRPNYETSVAIMALAAAGNDEFRPVIDRAAGFIKSLQRLEEDNPTWGGIGYGSDNTRSDLSNTQYALASLRAAGISKDDPVYQNAVKFLERTQNRKENETDGEPTEWTDPKTGKTVVRGNDGGANYFPGNSKGGVDERPDGVGVLRSYGSMTYALLRCYHFAGLPNDDPRVKAAVDWLADNWALDHNPGLSGEDRVSGIYYMYATMGRALSIAEIDVLEVPEKGSVDWRGELSTHLLAKQNEDGSWANLESTRWQEGDPILATSYALSALASCAR